jgi:hypothetical protein
MIGMALRAAQQDALAVEFEGPMFNKLDVADTEALVKLGLPCGARQSDFALIELRRFRRPKLWLSDPKGCNLTQAGPDREGIRGLVNEAAIRIENLHEN